MPPHPGSGQGENRNSNMHAPGYPPSGPPHMSAGPPHGYTAKMGHMPPGPPGSPYGQPGYQQGPGHQYPPSRPQGHIMQPYPQNYPSGGPQAPQGGPQGPPSAMPPGGHQYPPRPPPHNNHGPPNQPYGYPHFGQQGWGQSMGQSAIMGMKGGQMPPSPQQGSNSVGVHRPHTPPHYLKQHKLGGYPPLPSGPQMYPNGPVGAMPPSMANSRDSPQNAMPPPTSTPQPLTPSSSSAAEGEHLPSSAVTTATTTTVPNSISVNNTPTNNINSMNNNNPPQIGPDGNPVVDEASQQSTVSNTSIASGDDRSGTPKPHNDSMRQMLAGPPTGMIHPPAPVNSAPSPGTASMTSQQDDFESMNSPGWPRSPSGPPPGDSIMRLYEMSDSPDRRAWLDKLLRFMEDHKTPITTCPTISKNPLDLFNLYLHVRERGGFEEVTKNKHWKDVAAVMGIGASSSGSYTLRRHYMKHILAFECKYDRGGIDPQPIINQIESSQKKKNSKTMSVPSPGSNNSSSMDGTSNGPHMPGGPGMSASYPQYPPSSEYPGHMQQRLPNPSTPGYQGFQGSQYPGYQGMHGVYPAQGGSYSNSNYPPERGYQPTGPPNHPQGANYQGYQQSGGFQRPGFPPQPQPPLPPPSSQQGYQQDQYPPMGGSAPPPPPQSNYGNSQLAKQLLNPPSRNVAPVMQGFQPGGMYPQKTGSAPSPGPGPGPPPSSSAPGYQGPRRHPDFDKTQGGVWRPPNSQYGYGAQGPQGPPQQAWPRPNDSGGPPSGSPQWNHQPRYPPPPAQSSFPNQARWSSSFGGTGRPQGAPQVANKNYIVPQATSFKSGGYGNYMGKQLFPMDSVEAVSPIMVKRKRMGKTDIPQVDPWRLLMSLRCGMVSEVTWALDVLNILLFDDQTVIYFGLHHMPGLLEALIEHLRRGLINMFNICTELELGMDDEATGANKRIKAEQHDYNDRHWYEKPPPSPCLELDLGKIEDDVDLSDKQVFLKGPDYTLTTRTGKNVRLLNKELKLFMREGLREWDKWEGYDSGIDTWSVGGGECTAHIICCVQSAVPSLPFTRLIADKKRNKDYKSDLIAAPQPPVVSECVIKIEKVVDDIKVVKPNDEPVSVKKCSKDSSASPAFTPKLNRKNNAKISKLDDILKRIKKEPRGGSSSVSLFNKFANGDSQTDSKSILDQILNPDQSDKKLLPVAAVKDKFKSPLKSPSKLVIISSFDEQKNNSKQVNLDCRRNSSGGKRSHEDNEEESWMPDEASLSTTTEGQNWLAKRTIATGTVVRNLSFIPGNEDIMSRSAPLLALLGKTIMLHHSHPKRAPPTTHYDRDEETDFSDWCSSLAPDTFWWWPYLHHVHENTLVTMANIAGHLDLSSYPEEISRPILDGLLHWATCPASYGQDILPGTGTFSTSALSPQRLSLEALVKLCVLDHNTDLVLATPPFNRINQLCSQLTRLLCRGEDQVLREFAINLFHYFSAADSGVARVIALQNGCVSLLLSFIEEAESAALTVANLQGVTALKENPELMGTSLDMVRRSANTLVNLSRVPDNARVIMGCENRFLNLVMSQILDTYVASQLSQVLFNVAQVQGDSAPTSPTPFLGLKDVSEEEITNPNVAQPVDLPKDKKETATPS